MKILLTFQLDNKEEHFLEDVEAAIGALERMRRPRVDHEDTSGAAPASPPSGTSSAVIRSKELSIQERRRISNRRYRDKLKNPNEKTVILGPPVKPEPAEVKITKHTVIAPVDNRDPEQVAAAIERVRKEVSHDGKDLFKASGDKGFEVTP